MSIFACSLLLIEVNEQQAVYRFYPDQLHAAAATGTVCVDLADWTYSIREPSNGEEIGAVSSDAGCMYRLLPKLKGLFNSSGKWPNEVHHLS
jgi:hypothetical protein